MKKLLSSILFLIFIAGATESTWPLYQDLIDKAKINCGRCTQIAIDLFPLYVFPNVRTFKDKIYSPDYTVSITVSKTKDSADVAFLYMPFPTMKEYSLIRYTKIKNKWNQLSRITVNFIKRKGGIWEPQ